MALRKKIQILLWLFIAGLFVSGVTAIPLTTEVDWLVRATGARASNASWLSVWLLTVQGGLNNTSSVYPFLFYGTDWLAFGHFVIALAFIGPLRDPVKNIWVIEFGILASVLVIPFALIFGEVRGIPLPWRLIDCCFGLLGIFALGLAHAWIRRLSVGEQNLFKEVK
jgi:hypothetical protein